MTFDNYKKFNLETDLQRYSPRAWLQRHEAVCRQAMRFKGKGRKPAIALVVSKLFARASDDRNLVLAWEHVAAESGGTPGPDGETIESLGQENKYHFMRDLRNAIRSGDYEHGETREARIPKASGKGYRRLQIPDVLDRIAQRGVLQVLQPLLDEHFFSNSFGFRPALDRRHALAAAEVLIEGGRRVMVVEDLKNAFDVVPQRRLMDVIKPYANAPHFLALLGKIVRTPDCIGIRQGASLSPLLLNIYLHHVLDRIWLRKHKTVPLLRYGDDIALFCKSGDEAVEARSALQALIISAGFELKPRQTPSPFDLENGERVDWLGYDVGLNSSGLDVSVAASAWRSLGSKVHDAMQRQTKVVSTIKAWLGQMGPAYRTERLEEDWARIKRISKAAGWNMQITHSATKTNWERAHADWLTLRNEP